MKLLLFFIGAFSLISIPAKARDPKSIVVASKNFTENRILAEIMAQLIEAKSDLKVERQFNLGATAVVFSALRAGEIDLYPEYTGTGWYIHLKLPKQKLDPLKTYVIVKNKFLESFHLRWLLPFGLNNSYAIALKESRAKELGLKKISDIKKVEDKITMGPTHEFLKREDGYPALAKAYNLKVKNVVGLEHGLAYEAVISGKVDAIDAWTTDGKLTKFKLRLLEDDLRHFPPYFAAPVIREQTLIEHPEIERILNQLAYKISNDQMQKLNYMVEGGGASFAQVAKGFLTESKLLADDGLPKKSLKRQAWLNEIDYPKLLIQHLRLTFLALLAAILIAVPLGVVLTSYDRLADIILGAAGIIQTIPSLALLALMIPWFGLGVVPAIIALFLYSILPILRNTYTGIKGVDPEVIESAYAMGLKRHQVLMRIQLPLATSTIMAGIRTATVIGIGVATLAAFIGAGGLGEPIVMGLQLNDMSLVVGGAVPAALLALVADFLLGRMEFAIMPRGVKLSIQIAQEAS